MVCVGTLHEVKGQAYLIQACSKLQEKEIDFVCHFVGDGPDKEALVRLAEDLGIAEKVIFHGQQKQGEIARLLQNADVLAAPSVPTSDGRREGIPVVLIEAMSSGVPVIASNLSGIPELVVDGQQVLKRPERDGRQREPHVELESSHVGLHQPHSALHIRGLFRQARTAHLEHGGRGVESNDVDGGTRRRQQHATSAAAELEHVLAGEEPEQLEGNPRTGNLMTIPAAKVPRFRPSRTLKSAVR